MNSDIAKEVEKLADDFGIDKKRSIGDIAHELGVETHVIRFWEEQFPQIKPEIGKGGRRYYYNKQLKVLKRVKKFLHEEGYTIAGLQKLLKKRKHDSYREEDLDIIGGDASYAEHDIDDFIDSVNGISDFVVMKNVDPNNSDDFDSEQTPNANLVANIGRVNNINKAPEASISKEQREEISSLFKNITRNLGDLKMLLRS